MGGRKSILHTCLDEESLIFHTHDVRRSGVEPPTEMEDFGCPSLIHYWLNVLKKIKSIIKLGQNAGSGCQLL